MMTFPISTITGITAERGHRKKTRKNRILKLLRVLKVTKSRKRARTLRNTTQRSSFHLQNIIQGLTKYEVQRYLRMKRDTFAKLVQHLVMYLRKPWKSRGRGYFNYVPLDVRIVLALRTLAGGEVLDLQAAYGIPRSTIYAVTEEVIDAINSSMSFDGIPEDVDELCNISQSFKQSRRHLNPLTGCVGAIDGIAVKIDKPRDVRNPSSYYCRKGFYALPVQAICDGSYRFLWFSCLSVGSSHDSLALALSEFGDWMKECAIPTEFWIAGDEGYACRDMIVTPFSAKMNQDKKESNFNYFLSSYRVHIEQCFGMLVSKWRILRKKLSFSVRKSIRIISACMKLHNFIIQYEKGDEKHDQSSLRLQATYESSLLWYKEQKIAMQWVKRRQMLFETMDTEIELQQVLIPSTIPKPQGKDNAVRIRERLKNVVQEHGMERPAVRLLQTTTQGAICERKINRYIYKQ